MLNRKLILLPNEYTTYINEEDVRDAQKRGIKRDCVIGNESQSLNWTAATDFK